MYIAGSPFTSKTHFVQEAFGAAACHTLRRPWGGWAPVPSATTPTCCYCRQLQDLFRHT